MSDSRFIIVVAGGSGSRMKSSQPKQFLVLQDKPIIVHSIEAFTSTYPDIQVIVVLPKEYKSTWRKIEEQHKLTGKVKIAEGGNTRFHSVLNGLKLVDKNGIIGIHDAARPLVNETVIRATFNAAAMYGSAIPGIPLKDSIRRVGTNESIAVDRSKYCIVQTPQCFQASILRKAYLQDYKYTFTDDASVVEGTGESIHLVDGHSDNIKITTQRDLVIAKALMNERPITPPHNKLKNGDEIVVRKSNDS